MPRSLSLVALALLAFLVPDVAADTVTSGRILGANDGQPPAWAYVGLVSRSTIDAYPPGTSIWPDLLVETDGDGDYSFVVDDGDPRFHELYVFTMSPFHYDQIHAGIHGTYTLPYKEDFAQPGVVSLDGRQSNPDVDFSLYSSKGTQRILMRDGVTRLATDIYRPRLIGEDPTILVRTVYDKDGSADSAWLTWYGYNVVVQDSRGRFDSDGIDPVFRDDAWGANQDGYDTIEWIADRPWSDGKVGMYGGSALGITQYLASGAVPPSLECCYAVVASGNLYDGLAFTGGVFRKHMMEGWLQGQGSLHFLPELVAHPNLDAWWDEVDIVNRISQIQVPFFHFGGWFDILQEGATRGFHDLQHHGAPGARGTQKMLIGPWTHGGVFLQQQGELVFPPNATWDDDFSNSLAFFDYWLKGIDNGFYDLPAVRYYMMGDVDDPSAPGNEWRDADDWPPSSTEMPFFLQANGGLRRLRTGQVMHPRRVDGGTVSYLYDPADTAPTVGGANLILPAGPYDQQAVEQRSDVVVFTTAPLTAPLEVTGHVVAKLFISSTAPDTDFMVKLCDVYPDGRSMLIQEGAARARHREGYRTENLLQPGEVYPLEVDLWSTSIVFNAGHRIRVSVTSSNDPRYDPNPNTGEPFRQHTHLNPAVNTIHCTADAPSHIVLPIVE